jgi:hypothetical protein
MMEISVGEFFFEMRAPQRLVCEGTPETAGVLRPTATVGGNRNQSGHTIILKHSTSINAQSSGNFLKIFLWASWCPTSLSDVGDLSRYFDELLPRAERASLLTPDVRTEVRKVGGGDQRHPCCSPGVERSLRAVVAKLEELNFPRQ